MMDYDGLSGWEKYDIFSNFDAITLARPTDGQTDRQRTTGSTMEASNVIEAQTI